MDWQAVLARQHLGTLGLAAVAVTAVGFVHWAGAPAQRPFFLYDASISYISSGNSVSSAAAVCFSSILFMQIQEQDKKYVWAPSITKQHLSCEECILNECQNI